MIYEIRLPQRNAGDEVHVACLLKDFVAQSIEFRSQTVAVAKTRLVTGNAFLYAVDLSLES